MRQLTTVSLIRSDGCKRRWGWIINKSAVGQSTVRFGLAPNDGQIHRFASGRPVEFAIKGLPEPFSTRLYLATDENQEHLYVLEPERKPVSYPV